MGEKHCGGDCCHSTIRDYATNTYLLVILLPHKHVEIAKEEDVELELYELQSHINFCQYLLETPEIAMIETYNRLIMQVNYSISDAGKALREQKPDERIVVVREPFYWRLHRVEAYSSNRKGSRARGVLYFRKAE